MNLNLIHVSIVVARIFYDPSWSTPIFTIELFRQEMGVKWMSRAIGQQEVN